MEGNTLPGVVLLVGEEGVETEGTQSCTFSTPVPQFGHLSIFATHFIIMNET